MCHLTKTVKSAELSEVRVECTRMYSCSQLDHVAIAAPAMSLRDEMTEFQMTFHAPENCGTFTVRQLLGHILTLENATRPLSEWMGGIDQHQTYFEGLQQTSIDPILHLWFLGEAELRVVARQ